MFVYILASHPFPNQISAEHGLQQRYSFDQSPVHTKGLLYVSLYTGVFFRPFLVVHLPVHLYWFV